jgi:hypothetical protein
MKTIASYIDAVVTRIFRREPKPNAPLWGPVEISLIKNFLLVTADNPTGENPEKEK